MADDPTERPARSSLGVAVLAVLPVLCCAAPALLTAGALGALGSWLTSPWLIGAAVLLVLAVVGRRRQHRGATAAGDSAFGPCCPRLARAITRLPTAEATRGDGDELPAIVTGERSPAGPARRTAAGSAPRLGAPAAPPAGRGRAGRRRRAEHTAGRRVVGDRAVLCRARAAGYRGRRRGRSRQRGRRGRGRWVAVPRCRCRSARRGGVSRAPRDSSPAPFDFGPGVLFRLARPVEIPRNPP